METVRPETERLLASIRAEYQKTHNRIHVSEIYKISDLPEYETRKSLEFLVNAGLVSLQFQWVAPNIERQSENIFIENKTKIVRENITALLNELGMSKPAKIIEEYIIRFGTINTEGLSREVRRMYASGTLERQGDLYFVKRKFGYQGLERWIRQ